MAYKRRPTRRKVKKPTARGRARTSRRTTSRRRTSAPRNSTQTLRVVVEQSGSTAPGFVPTHLPTIPGTNAVMAQGRKRRC